MSGTPPEHWIAMAALAFFGAGGLSLVYTVERGKALCRRFAERYPTQYAALESPRPG